MQCDGLILIVVLSFLTLSRFFFFNDTATTEIYTLSLHDALPISLTRCARKDMTMGASSCSSWAAPPLPRPVAWRSEEHTSELQSQSNLVCRLLLEKKKKVTPKTEKSTQTIQRKRAPSGHTDDVDA